MEAQELAQRVADAVEARFCASVGVPIVTRTPVSVSISMTVSGMVPADELRVVVTAPDAHFPRRWAVSVGYRPPFETTFYSFVHYTEPRDFPVTLSHATAAMLAHMERTF